MNRLALAPLALVLAAAAACGSDPVAQPADPPTTTAPTTTTAVPATFGPVGYAGVRLGMTAAQARAAGATFGTAGAAPGCRGFRLAHSAAAANEYDGWLSAKHGVVLIVSDVASAATPEGMRVGSTPAQVRAAYPDAEHAPDFWRAAVPGHAGTSYWWDYAGGEVGALTLVRDDQDCVN